MIHSGKLLFQIRKRTLLIHIKNKTYRNFVILCFCSIYISLPPPHRIRKMNNGSIIRTRLHGYSPAVLHYYK